MDRSKLLRPTLLVVIALAVVLLPFAVFGQQLDAWVAAFLLGRDGIAIFVAVVVLLAADILLPIPSSLVSLTAGAALGTWPGAAAVWVGMTTGSAVGWAAGRGLLGGLSHDVEQGGSGSAFGKLSEMSDAMALILCRPVPVLAEMSVLVLSARGMTFRRLIAICAAANVPIALLFAYFGAQARDTVPISYLVGALLLVALVAALVRQNR